MSEVPAIGELILSARAGQPDWEKLRVSQRAARFTKAKGRFLERQDELVQSIVDETGKPEAEALFEVILCIKTIDSLGRAASGVFTPAFEHPGLMELHLRGMRASTVRKPYGVVAVVSSWNYPLFLPLQHILPALMAGNAVLFSPSPLTPGTGEMLCQILWDSEIPPSVLHFVSGGEEAAKELLAADIDCLSFVGSTRTGKQVAVQAAERLLPVVLELGGKDAAIVCDDANLDVAAQGICWAAFMNAGQTCTRIERVLVEEKVAAPFTAALLEALAEVEVGPVGSVCPLRRPAEAERARRIVREAIDGGAELVAGELDDSSGALFAPIVLTNVPENSEVWREEVFAPVLCLNIVRNAEEAIERANDTGYAMGASIWSAGTHRAKRLAARLRAPVVHINGHATSFAFPTMPWGGRGNSGLGFLGGRDGIRAFTYPQTVVSDRQRRRWWWFPYRQEVCEFFRAAAPVLYGTHPSSKVKALPALLAASCRFFFARRRRG